MQSHSPALGKTARNELRKMGLASAYGFQMLRAIGASRRKLGERSVSLDSAHAGLVRDHDALVFRVGNNPRYADRVAESMQAIKANREQAAAIADELAALDSRESSIHVWHRPVAVLVERFLKHFNVSGLQSLIPGFDDGDTSGEAFRAGAQSAAAEAGASSFGGLGLGGYR